MAAEAVLVATDLLNPADWFFVGQNYREFYRDNEYVKQMDRLNKFCDEFPQASFAQSLRAYHFFGLGHQQAATQMLHRAIEINPQDPLAQRLIAATGNSKIVAPAPMLFSSPTTQRPPAPQSTRKVDDVFSSGKRRLLISETTSSSTLSYRQTLFPIRTYLMPFYQALQTQKYWQQALNQELKEHRRQRSREAIEAFKMFAFAIVFIVGVGYAIQTMPSWLPATIEFMEYYGVIPSRQFLN